MAKSKHQARGNSSRNRNRSGNSSRNRNRSGNKGKYKLYVSGPGFHTQLTLNPPNQSSVKFTDQQGRQTEILVDVKNVRSLKGTTSSTGDGKNSSRKETGLLSRSSITSDKILSKLAGKIGEGWSQFGIQHLGMSKVDIDHFKHNRSTMEDTIFDMLYEWRQRHHDDATIGKLLDLMEESPNISLDSYNFILEELHGSDLQVQE